MSYYYKHKFSFSTHSIQRIQKRLNLKEGNEFMLKDQIIKLIDNVISSFRTSKYEYLEIKKGIYLVVDIFTKTIITCSPISISKQLWLLECE